MSGSPILSPNNIFNSNKSIPISANRGGQITLKSPVLSPTLATNLPSSTTSAVQPKLSPIISPTFTTTDVRPKISPVISTYPSANEKTKWKIPSSLLSKETTSEVMGSLLTPEAVESSGEVLIHKDMPPLHYLCLLRVYSGNPNFLRIEVDDSICPPTHFNEIAQFNPATILAKETNYEYYVKLFYFIRRLYNFVGSDPRFQAAPDQDKLLIVERLRKFIYNTFTGSSQLNRKIVTPGVIEKDSGLYYMLTTLTNYERWLLIRDKAVPESFAKLSKGVREFGTMYANEKSKAIIPDFNIPEVNKKYELLKMKLQKLDQQLNKDWSSFQSIVNTQHFNPTEFSNIVKDPSVLQNGSNIIKEIQSIKSSYAPYLQDMK